MDITETVRHSTWYRRSTGRRAMSTEPPYFSIAQPDDDVSRRDALRRRTLARMAGFGL